MSDSLLTPYELFQRKDSPNYWMRFSVRGKGQVRVGLKTADPEKAAERAKVEHLRYQLRAEDGKFASPKTFEKIAKAYLDDLNRQVELGIKKEYRQQSDGHAVRDFLIPFFGKDRIETITEAKISSSSAGGNPTGSMDPAKASRSASTNVTAGAIFRRSSGRCQRRTRSAATARCSATCSDLPLRTEKSAVRTFP